MEKVGSEKGEDISGKRMKRKKGKDKWQGGG